MFIQYKNILINAEKAFSKLNIVYYLLNIKANLPSTLKVC